MTNLFHLPANLWIWFGAPLKGSTLTTLLYAWLGMHVLRIAGALAATVFGIQALVAEGATVPHHRAEQHRPMSQQPVPRSSVSASIGPTIAP